MSLLLLLSIVLVIAGVIKFIQGDPALGIVLIVIGLLLGPGVYNLLT